PAGTPDGSYAVVATYNPGPDFTGSSDPAHHLAVTSATHAPVVLAVNGNDAVAVAPGQAFATANVQASSPLGKPLTYTAVAIGHDPLYQLQQRYKFQGLRYFTDAAGTGAYVLQAAANNAHGNNHYLI